MYTVADAICEVEVVAVTVWVPTVGGGVYRPVVCDRSHSRRSTAYAVHGPGNGATGIRSSELLCHGVGERRHPRADRETGSVPLSVMVLRARLGIIGDGEPQRFSYLLR
jgi:hypothetical protein